MDWKKIFSFCAIQWRRLNHPKIKQKKRVFIAKKISSEDYYFRFAKMVFIETLALQNANSKNGVGIWSRVTSIWNPFFFIKFCIGICLYPTCRIELIHRLLLLILFRQQQPHLFSPKKIFFFTCNCYLIPLKYRNWRRTKSNGTWLSTGKIRTNFILFIERYKMNRENQVTRIGIAFVWYVKA